jgi:YesN/AraC family two-component response regulator
MQNGSGAPRVLIVDDDEDVRHTLRLLFEVESYDVVGEADNGKDGLLMTLTLRPDIVLLDHRMPGVMDGAATAECIREALPDVKVVAFSGVLQEKPEWADAFLSKERITEVAPLLMSLI